MNRIHYLVKDSPLITCLITQEDVDKWDIPQSLVGLAVARKAQWWSRYTDIPRKIINARKSSEHKDIAEGREPRDTRTLVGLERLERRPSYRKAKKPNAPVFISEKQLFINSWFSRAMVS